MVAAAPLMLELSLKVRRYKCGSDSLEKRGQKYYATFAGIYQQYRCRSCHSWVRGTKRLATSELR